MASKAVLFVCVQAILAQCAFGQLNRGYRPALPSLASISGNSVIENNLVIGNNAGFGGIGLANAGVIGSNIGLANTGILNSGVAGIGLANTGLIGNAVLPAVTTNYLDLTSVSSGGVLPINSFSPIVPAGLNVVSENAIEGPVGIFGQLPFLSAVAFEGALASEGMGAAGCGCGTTGNIGIVSETYGPVAAPALGQGFGGRLL
ncbi:uncharacterized protein ACR2FA_009907 [Aphomia sociella]